MDNKPKYVGTWTVAVTDEGDLIKWGKDGGTEYPYHTDEEANAQAQYLANTYNHMGDTLYLLKLFDNGQMVTFAVEPTN